MTLQPPAIDPMFQPGARYRLSFDDIEEEAVVEVRDAGRLYLATGRLVVCDPFWASLLEDRTAAFTVAVPPGHYQITVSFARVDRPSDPEIAGPVRRGAAARLTVRDDRVAGWEPALRPGDDLASLPPGRFHGFAVDSGTGAFVDASAVAALGQLGEPGQEMGQEPELAEVIPELLEKGTVNLVVDQATDLNVVMFDCGMGDGTYPVWIGRTAAGDAACFVADLELLSHGQGPITD
jgi:hypothetical protein